MAELRQAAQNLWGESGTRTWHGTAADRIEGGQKMFGRLAKAGLRAVLMSLLVAVPSVLLPTTPADTRQIVVLVALIAAVLTFVEYYSNAPSIVEFRDAPPFNRIRFAALFVTVAALAIIQRGATDPSTMTRVFELIGASVASWLDFPYSPVRLVVLMLPESADAALVGSVRIAAGLSYLVSVVALVVVVVAVRQWGWPRGPGGFNVWVNLPTFDPTAGGDVVSRLSRDSQINLILGFLLPFLIPAVVKLASDLFDPISLADPHTLIWTMTAWAFLPASLLMRGIALDRLARMICQQRKRAEAVAAEGLQAA